MIKLLYLVENVFGATASGSEESEFLDHPKKNIILTPAVKCLICDTLLIFRNVFVDTNHSSGIDLNGQLNSVIARDVYKNVLVCPNKDCQLSVGAGKGIYLSDNGDMLIPTKKYIFLLQYETQILPNILDILDILSSSDDDDVFEPDN